MNVTQNNEQTTGTPITVRPARTEEIALVNGMRRELNAIHAQGRPEFFRPQMRPELEELTQAFIAGEDTDVLVAVLDGEVVGYAMIRLVNSPEGIYGYAQRFYHVEELCVAEAHRRCGAGRALVEYMKRDAASRGYERMTLDMWAFNDRALQFYDACGFKVFRRCMEITALK